MGSWFSEDFKGTRFPTLVEAVNCVNELELGLDIEIKHLRVNADDDTPADSEIAEREREIAKETCKVLKKMQDEGVSLDRILLSSFSTHALEIAHHEMASIKRCLLVEAIPHATWKTDFDRLECSSFIFNNKKVTKDEVTAIRDMGVPMYSYTVNDAKRASDLLVWGVTGVFADCPDEVERGVAEIEAEALLAVEIAAPPQIVSAAA